LTAGSLDDHAQFAEYSAYLSHAMQLDRREELPRFAIGRRAVVRVVNEQGQPIGDARVAISQFNESAVAQAGQQTAVGSPHVPFEMTTGVDGQVVFLSGLDAQASESEFSLMVIPPGGGQPVTQRVSLEQTPWQVTLSQTRQTLPIQLDLALVIDTTGSMGDELNYLKVEIDHIAAEVHARFPNVDQHYGMILYRDQGDAYVTRSFDFTSSLADFRRTLAAQSAEGGGDYPEAMHLALENCTQLAWRGAGTARVAFLVADAPPHTQFAQRTLDAVQKLRRAGVTVFPVASSGVRDQAEFIMRAIGFLTQGRYLFLTDHSGVGDSHAKPHAPSYAVEKLDQLMIRMIAEKLSGRSGLPTDVIAVEESNPGAGPSPTVNAPNAPAANPIQQPDVSSSSPTLNRVDPVPVPATQPGTSESRTVAENGKVPTDAGAWGVVKAVLLIGAAILVVVAERVFGV
jgi:hypothetical protein